MKIEAGKWYKTENGKKAYIYATNRTGGFPIHGLVSECGSEHCFQWLHDGDASLGYALSSEWIDRPEMDWSALPKWAKWIAMDKGGLWFWYSNDIEHDDVECWFSEDLYGEIPYSHWPTWSGDWRNSNVEVKR